MKIVENLPEKIEETIIVTNKVVASNIVIHVGGAVFMNGVEAKSISCPGNLVLHGGAHMGSIEAKSIYSTCGIKSGSINVMDDITTGGDLEATESIDCHGDITSGTIRTDRIHAGRIISCCGGIRANVIEAGNAITCRRSISMLGQGGLIKSPIIYAECIENSHNAFIISSDIRTRTIPFEREYYSSLEIFSPLLEILMSPGIHADELIEALHTEYNGDWEWLDSLFPWQIAGQFKCALDIQERFETPGKFLDVHD
ncbi:MAG: hypothetical protein SVK08_00495 [Halobacteriota archaeon]|nr:hypothetical protein [Halobacteriota archaeon]